MLQSSKTNRPNAPAPTSTFASPIIYATLCVPEAWSEADIQDLIADLDDRIASTADPLRDDLIVTVWRGAEVGVYSQEADVADPPNDPAAQHRPAANGSTGE